MKILIAPDSFKGSASAASVANCLALGISKAIEGKNEIEKIPLADGGEGTAEALGNALGGFKEVESDCLNANRRPIKAKWHFNKRTKIALIDMAAASGITLIPKNKLNILGANTYGTGQLIKEAINAGANEIYLGLGGSATNDAGIGMASALGFKFLDAFENEVLPIPLNFRLINKVLAPIGLQLPKVTAIYDVEIPLLGAHGSVAKYSEQKGANSIEKKFLEEGLNHLVNLLQNHNELNPGAGAAGGLGYGVCSFLNAALKPGFEFIAKTLGLEDKIQNCDFVITGEGKADLQTIDGKLVKGLSQLALKHKKPVILVAGQIHNSLVLKEQLKLRDMVSLSNMVDSPETAILQVEELLIKTGESLAHKYLDS